MLAFLAARRRKGLSPEPRRRPSCPVGTSGRRRRAERRDQRRRDEPQELALGLERQDDAVEQRQHAARAFGADPVPAYVREEASIFVTAVSATAAGAMLLGGLVRRPRGVSDASLFRAFRLEACR